MANSQGFEPVELPTEVLDRIDARVDHTEFEDTTAYITHILEEVLYELEQDIDRADADTVDEQQVQERLKSLGYLNE
jgi:predicted glycosyltransferase